MSESVAVGATPSPVRRKLLGFTIVVMGVLFLGRVLGLARDLIVAPLFGASIEVDALVAARTIPELVLAVVAGDLELDGGNVTLHVAHGLIDAVASDVDETGPGGSTATVNLVVHQRTVMRRPASDILLVK